MKIFKKLTCRSLRLNKKRTTLTICGIALSVALIVALTSLVSSLYYTERADEIRSEGDFHFLLNNVPYDELEDIEANRAVEEYYTTRILGYALISSSNESKPYACILAADEKAMENLSFNLIDGRLPENENEIVIPRHLKTNGRVELNIGDEITLSVGNRLYDGIEMDQGMEYTDGEELTNSSTKTYTVVGIMERPGYFTEGFSAPGYTFLTCMEEFEGKMTVYVKLSNKYIKDYKDVLDGILQLDEFEYNVHTRLISLYTISDDGSGRINTVIKLMAIIAVIIVVTSVFCIKNSFDISITEKIRQYGMLASIGATSKQIRKNVYYEAGLLGLVGIPAGMVLGILASYTLVQVMNFLIGNQMTIQMEFHISWWCVLAAIILGVITIYLSAIKSAHRASRISPITAIRNPENSNINDRLLKTPSYIRKIFGTGGVVAYKNLKRNKKKYRTISITIGICTIAFIAVSSFMSMIYREIEIQYGRKDYNLCVTLCAANNDADKTDLLSAAETISNMESIKRCAVLRSVYLQVENPEITDEYLAYITELFGYYDMSKEEILEDYGTYVEIVSLGDSEYESYVKSLGLNPDKLLEKAVFINDYLIYTNENGKAIKKQITTYDYSAGDKIYGLIEDYDPDTYTGFDLEVAAVTSEHPMGLSEYYSNGYLVVSDSYMDTIPYETNYIIIYIESSDVDTLQDEIEDYLGDDIEYDMSNTDKEMQDMKNLYILMDIFAYGFIIVIALIGITNAVNTINTSMELRTREFAMLKSVGMTKKEFNHMVSLETVFYGIKSLGIGIIGGTALSYVIYRILIGTEVELKYQLPIGAIIISIITIFMLLFCIMRFSIKKINRKNIIEAIKNENI